MGITLVKKDIQLEAIDPELLNGLWNVFRRNFLEEIGHEYKPTNQSPAAEHYCYKLWHEFFKGKVENIPYQYLDTIKAIRDYFYTFQWFHVYDIIDFTYKIIISKEFEMLGGYIDVDELTSKFNEVLEREFSGYRILNNSVVPISNHQEIGEIQDAITSLNNFSSLKVCNTHLTAGLQKLSDRINPDYRNSIKESISAVEALAKIISGNPKDSLGAAIDKIKGRLKVHASLERAIKSIYGYTSDSDGIRHALTEESNIDFEDAKFMLVSCSAFVNYLISKSHKAGINL